MKSASTEMVERGFLLIADISGYTRFLAGSELDHAHGVLEDLLSVILERLKSPLHLSNIQGDAVFAFSLDDEIWSSGQIVDSIEALYFGFRDRLKSIIDNTTCPCRACVNARRLDLKFVIHHGEFMVQTVAGRQELTGSDVILLHRLLKNDIALYTGIASYALFTSAAAAALDQDKFMEGHREYSVDLDEFGPIKGLVIDIATRWQLHDETNEIVVSNDNLWFDPISRTMPYSVESVWEAYCNPDLKSRWNTIFDGFTRVVGDPQRVAVGAVDHCEHGKQTLVIRYVDVRPFRHVTLEIALPMNGWARWTVLFAPENAATRVTLMVGKAQASSRLVTALLSIATHLQKKKVRADFVAQLELMDAFLASNDKTRSGTGEASQPLSPAEINEAANKMITQR